MYPLTWRSTAEERKNKAQYDLKSMKYEEESKTMRMKESSRQ
jgi:hypothetical protein